MHVTLHVLIALQFDGQAPSLSLTRTFHQRLSYHCYVSRCSDVGVHLRKAACECIRAVHNAPAHAACAF